MKNNFKYILSLIFLFTINQVYAQNLPIPTSGTVNTVPFTLPKPFNSSGNTAPVNFNYTRTWAPVIPLTNVTDVIAPTTNVKHSTTYINGSGESIQTISCMSDFSHDMVTVFDNRNSNNKASLLSYPIPKNGTFQMNPFSDQVAYYQGVFPQEQGFSFSINSNTANNGIQQKSNFQAGAHNAGVRTGSTQTMTFNTVADDVKIWNTDNNIYQNGVYGDNTLFKKATFGANNSQVIEFYDKDNKLIQKKSLVGTNSWIKTYYVYNDLGRLVMIITPKAVALLDNNGYNLTSDIINGLCYTYQYGDNGELVSKHSPDQKGVISSIFDAQHRAILIQTPSLLSTKKYKFNIYDNSGRIVITGLYSTLDNPKKIQSDINAGQSSPGSIYNYLINGFDGDYTSAINNTIPSCEVHEINFYDIYDQDPDLQHRPFVADTNFLSGPQYVNPIMYANAMGLQTGKKTLVIGAGLANKWVSSIFFYDSHKRLIQTQTKDAFNDNNSINLSTTQYQFDGKPVIKIEEHFAWNSAKKNSTKVVKKYEYDNLNAGRLKSVQIRMDNSPAWRKLAQYFYNDRGQIKQAVIGQVEYQYVNYNIRGQLSDLNKDYLSGSNCTDCESMTFAEQLGYETGFSTSRLDGSISGFIWRGAGAGAIKRAYGYNYDVAGRLSSADFRQWEFSPNHLNGYDWDNQLSDYSVGNVTYDENGNLLSLKQRGVYNGTIVDIDKLAYTYNSASNKLDNIADTVTTSFNGLNDFTDSHLGIGDYDFDRDGNLTIDRNKDLQIDYNYQDNPTSVVKGNGDNIQNIYSGDGALLQKTISTNGHSDVYRYAGSMVYRNDSLLYVLHDEGRARWLADSNMFKFDYFIKDHLGNIRTTVAADYGNTLGYLATHEVASANLEQAIFDGMGIARTTKPNSTDPNDQEAAGLDGSDPAKRIGTSILIKVMAGDKFNVSADSYYDNTGNTNVGPDAGSMLAAITSTLIGGQGGLNPGEAGQNSDIVNHLFSPDNYLNVYEGLKESMTNPEYPRAYLNYIVFDEDMRIVPEQSGAIQVGATANVWTALELPTDIKIGKNGFLGVYISDEQNKKVWFDNVQLTYYKGRLLEEQHYYPHGLAISSGANDPVPNKFKYQGKELQDDLGMQLYDFQARQYDPQIGRFWGVDPADQFPSGYTGMANDPANNIDPTGMLAVGAVQYGQSSGAYGNSGGEGVNVDGLPTSDEIDQMQDDLNAKGEEVDRKRNATDAGQGIVVQSFSNDASTNALFATLLAGQGYADVMVTSSAATTGLAITGVSSASTLGFLAMTIAGVALPTNFGEQPHSEFPNWAFPGGGAMVPLQVYQWKPAYQTLAKGAAGFIELLKMAKGPDALVYRLYATKDGYYPVVEYGKKLPVGVKFLKAGETWKYGMTTKDNVYGSSKDSRYTPNSPDSKYPAGITDQVIYNGNKYQAQFMEHMLIMQYYFEFGTLPPGNKVPW